MVNNTGTAKQAKQGTAKYRPSLSAENIRHILALAKTEKPAISAASMKVIAVLSPFLAKIENDALAASHTASYKPSMLELLGCTEKQELEQPVHDKGAPKDYPATRSYDNESGLHATILPEHYGDNAAYWQACYQKHLDWPESCTLQEIQAAQEHRYLAGLMTEAEMVAFEAGTL